MALFLPRCVDVSNRELVSLLRTIMKPFMHLHRLLWDCSATCLVL